MLGRLERVSAFARRAEQSSRYESHAAHRWRSPGLRSERIPQERRDETIRSRERERGREARRPRAWRAREGDGTRESSHELTQLQLTTWVNGDLGPTPSPSGCMPREKSALATPRRDRIHTATSRIKTTSMMIRVPILKFVIFLTL